jgi:hypothetical protein
VRTSGVLKLWKITKIIRFGWFWYQNDHHTPKIILSYSFTRFSTLKNITDLHPFYLVIFYIENFDRICQKFIVSKNLLSLFHCNRLFWKKWKIEKRKPQILRKILKNENCRNKSDLLISIWKFRQKVVRKNVMISKYAPLASTTPLTRCRELGRSAAQIFFLIKFLQNYLPHLRNFNFFGILIWWINIASSSAAAAS